MRISPVKGHIPSPVDTGKYKSEDANLDSFVLCHPVDALKDTTTDPPMKTKRLSTNTSPNTEHSSDPTILFNITGTDMRDTAPEGGDGDVHHDT